MRRELLFPERSNTLDFLQLIIDLENKFPKTKGAKASQFIGHPKPTFLKVWQKLEFEVNAVGFIWEDGDTHIQIQWKRVVLTRKAASLRDAHVQGILLEAMDIAIKNKQYESLYR